MNTLLWVCQGFLAVVFLYSGIMKSTQTEQHLIAIGQTGVEGLSIYLIRFIGIIEIAGVIGLIVPWWLGIAKFITPLSAIGFAVIMLLATPIHYKRNELQSVCINIGILLVCILVAYGRMRPL